MSYTAPQYVDTKEQAILALASTIAGEDKTNLGDGSVNRALDVLADVLAKQDVQVPQTNAGAILALAQYASGMVKPEGTIAITENGEGIDVAQYATADVNVAGGGGSATTDVYLWNNNEDEYADKIPSKVWYVSDYEGSTPTFTELQFEPATTEFLGSTVYGVKVKDCPVGALFNGMPLNSVSTIISGITFIYSVDTFQPPATSEFSSSAACPMPISGLNVTGYYLVSGIE